MIKYIKRVFTFIVAGYLLICVSLFFFQERLLFFPKSLKNDYEFRFEHDFIEENIVTKRGDTMNSLLFKVA
jgi:hypothetical protein